MTDTPHRKADEEYPSIAEIDAIIWTDSDGEEHRAELDGSGVDGEEDDEDSPFLDALEWNYE